MEHQMMTTRPICPLVVWLSGRIQNQIWLKMAMEVRWIKGHKQHWTRLCKWTKMNKTSNGKGHAVTHCQTWLSPKRRTVSMTPILKIIKKKILGIRKSLNTCSSWSETLAMKFKSTLLWDEKSDEESRNYWVVSYNPQTWSRRINSRATMKRLLNSWKSKVSTWKDRSLMRLLTVRFVTWVMVVGLIFISCPKFKLVNTELLRSSWALITTPQLISGVLHVWSLNWSPVTFYSILGLDRITKKMTII